MDYMNTNMRAVPSSGFAYDLVNRVRRGEIVPAKFQRPYVWTEDDVLALFRSIMMGISIGSFLIWEPSPDMNFEELGRDRLGPVSRESAEKVRSSGLLLDGQNRLATIAWAAHSGPVPDHVIDALSPQEKAVWCSGKTLVLDYATRSICFVPDADVETGLRIPLSTIIKYDFRALTAAAQRWENELGKSDKSVGDMLELFERCNRRIMSARAADITISDATIDEAREAFMNICRVGVPMSQGDFDNAIQWKPGQ